MNLIYTYVFNQFILFFLYQNYCSLFEERAIGVINECYAANEKMALQLLVKQRDNWGKTSCILIAVNADNKRFISQTACQSLLTKIWMGEMDNSNSRWKVSYIPGLTTF